MKEIWYRHKTTLHWVYARYWKMSSYLHLHDARMNLYGINIFQHQNQAKSKMIKIWNTCRFLYLQWLFEYVLFTFTFNCGVRLSSGESILGGGVCDLSSVSNGSPSERSSPFLGLWKVDKGNKFITSRVLHILWNEWHLNF